MKPNLEYHLSQLGECVYGVQSWKEIRLLSEPVFVPIERWTLIPKMGEREVFLMKPKNQFIYPN